MSFNFWCLSKGLFLCIFILYGFDGVFDFVVAKRKESMKLYYVRNVCEYLLIFPLHTQINKSSGGSFNFFGYYTVAPQW
jgi:hypothetical protein